MAKSKAPPNMLLAYLRLLRLPNVFTAISDVAMGYVVVQHGFQPAVPFVGLILATSLLYCGGMVLNDVFDIEVDRKERPKRPLPAGTIALGKARNLGFSMLVGGVVLAWLSGIIPGGQAAMPWRSGAMATVLAVTIVAYNAMLKKTLLGPLAMGACRFLNILMGMGLARIVSERDGATLGYAPFQLMVAGSIGIYIVGITIFSRQEVEKGGRAPLFFAWLLVVAGLAGLAFFGDFAPLDWMSTKREIRILLIIAVGFSIARRCFTAVHDPSPKNVQVAIKHALMSLIILDAAVVAQVAGAGWAACVLLLLVPAMMLGKWVYST